MLNQELAEQVTQVKSWKYKLERVAKGYVRPTIHSDRLDELLEDWKTVHEQLALMGEKVERLE